MHRIAAAALGVVALVTLTASCGDDSSSADTVASTTTVAAETTVVETTPVDKTVVEETVVDETVVDETLVDDTAGSGGPGDGTEFCQLNSDLDEVGGNIFSGDATPEEVQDFFEVEFPETIAELTAVAPAEIADDLAISVEGFGILTTELAAHDWDVAATFSDPAVADLINIPLYNDASDAISAFCGE